MSAPQHAVSGCLGKESFPNGGVARQVAQRMSARGKTVQSYGCTHCGQWHVGQPQRAERLKYGNTLTKVGEITFHSKKEAKRFGDLTLLQRAGEISELKRQVKFPIIISDTLICTYIADFVYLDSHGERVVEDVKGYATEVYNLKCKLMKVVLNITILET